MKKNLILTMGLFMLSLCAVAQDWTGRVYQCTQSDQIRLQMVNEMKSDPDFDKMDDTEKTYTAMLIGCIDVKLALKFKKDNKVTQSAYITLNEEKMKQAGIPSMLNEPFKQMIRGMQDDMKETFTYSFKPGILVIDGDEYAILEDGKKLSTTLNDVKLTFVRK